MPDNILSPDTLSLDPQLVESVKSRDPDRYRAALMAATGPRAALMTLYAFHFELAKVPEYVSEPMIGAIRYQWWRDAVAEIYEGGPVRKHEVATPLASVLLDNKVPRYWVDGLIDGRERDLDPRPFEGLDAAKDYCAATSSKLMQIAVQIAAPNVRLSAGQTDGLNAAGIAWGLTGLARAFKFYHASMLSGVAFGDLIDGAQSDYENAGRALGKIESSIMPAVMYAALVPKYLARLRTVNDPKTEAVSYGPLSKQIRLAGAAVRGRI